MNEKIKRKSIKIGSSVGFTIPSFLIKNEKIVLGKEYNIIITDEDQ